MVVRRFFMVVVLIMGSHLMKAQAKFGLEYNGELQTDFCGAYNFPNLLRLDAEIQVNSMFSFEAASISIAKTSAERLVDDLQTFSNIEEDNLPFVMALLGASFSLSDGHSLYVGIRNVNEDYFTSPVTSLFTNSSCGIFPTISCNYPIANYPLSSMCLHYGYGSEHWQALASIYNGKGYNRMFGHETVLRFCPASDGMFLTSQAGYLNEGCSYYLGSCFHTAQRSGAVWSYAEQRISSNISLVADCSHAFGASVPCKDFFGIGARYELHKAELGLFSDYARFVSNFEWATELTCSFLLSEHVSVRPALHLMQQKDMKAAVGLLRLSICI